MPQNDPKSFLLRLDKRMLESLQRWADDEFRSVNGQIEWILREALRRNSRWADKSEKK